MQTCLNRLGNVPGPTASQMPFRAGAKIAARWPAILFICLRRKIEWLTPQPLFYQHRWAFTPRTLPNARLSLYISTILAVALARDESVAV